MKFFKIFIPMVVLCFQDEIVLHEYYIFMHTPMIIPSFVCAVIKRFFDKVFLSIIKLLSCSLKALGQIF